MIFKCDMTSIQVHNEKTAKELIKFHPKAVARKDEKCGCDKIRTEIELSSLKDLIQFLNECPSKEAVVGIDYDGTFTIEDYDTYRE